MHLTSFHGGPAIWIAGSPDWIGKSMPIDGSAAGDRFVMATEMEE